MIYAVLAIIILFILFIFWVNSEIRKIEKNDNSNSWD